MRFRSTSTLALCVLTVSLVVPSLAQGSKTPWRLTGDLSEACTCAVPCTCNFGANPSPHAYCYALYSLDIKEGHYGDLDLSGLRLAGANGAKGTVWFIDDRATKEQAAALRSIAKTIGISALKANGIKDPTKAPPEFRFRGFKTAKITQEVGEKSSRLKIGDFGSFDNTYLVGIDGKTPVVVENNYSWNIQHGIKGKTKRLRYKDDFGNVIDGTETNANQGKFDWSDTTPIYFR